MAAPYDTYDVVASNAKSIKEDVDDSIHMISPVDNPVASMSRTITAINHVHNWQEDELASASANKKVEGADASFQDETPPSLRTTYTQIMDKTAQVTGSLEAVSKYGRDSEMAYQLMKKYRELANDEEFAYVGSGRQTGNAGGSATARECVSVHAQINTGGNVADATGITTYAQLEAKIVDAHKEAYDDGGYPNYMMIPTLVAPYIANFALASGRERDFGGSRTVVHVVDMYISPYGELDVVVDRQLDNDSILLLDFEYMATPTLRPTDDWEIARTGDSLKRQILREGAIACLNFSAHAMVDNVPASLSAA